MSAWLRPRSNCIGKIFTLQPQWLNPVDVWNSNFTIPIRDYRVSVHISSLVINLDHLSRICVVIDRHSCITDHRHPADLTGMEPTHVDVRRHSVCEFKVEMSNIMNMRLQMCMCLDFNPFRFLAKYIEQYRYIMRGKIPYNIDITAK